MDGSTSPLTWSGSLRIQSPRAMQKTPTIKLMRRVATSQPRTVSLPRKMARDSSRLRTMCTGLGLKFGIQILQGIPRPALTNNLPIADSSFRASDAANISGTCKWNYDYYDLRHNAAGQA